MPAKPVTRTPQEALAEKRFAEIEREVAGHSGYFVQRDGRRISPRFNTEAEAAQWALDHRPGSRR